MVVAVLEGAVLVVGAGRVAELLPAAYAAVRGIERVSLWARRPEARLALREQAWCDAVADTPEEAARIEEIKGDENAAIMDNLIKHK